MYKLNEKESGVYIIFPLYIYIIKYILNIEHDMTYFLIMNKYFTCLHLRACVELCDGGGGKYRSGAENARSFIFKLHQTQSDIPYTSQYRDLPSPDPVPVFVPVPLQNSESIRIMPITF